MTNNATSVRLRDRLPLELRDAVGGASRANEGETGRSRRRSTGSDARARGGRALTDVLDAVGVPRDSPLRVALGETTSGAPPGSPWNASQTNPCVRQQRLAGSPAWRWRERGLNKWNKTWLGGEHAFDAASESGQLPRWSGW